MTHGHGGSGLMLPLWEDVLWPFLDACGCGPYGELFFFFLRKEPMVIRELVRFGPSFPMEAEKSMCLGRFAHDSRREFLAVGQWFLGFVEQLE